MQDIKYFMLKIFWQTNPKSQWGAAVAQCIRTWLRKQRVHRLKSSYGLVAEEVPVGFPGTIMVPLCS